MVVEVEVVGPQMVNVPGLGVGAPATVTLVAFEVAAVEVLVAATLAWLVMVVPAAPVTVVMMVLTAVCPAPTFEAVQVIGCVPLAATVPAVQFELRA
jgi:hypothetical protein